MPGRMLGNKRTVKTQALELRKRAQRLQHGRGNVLSQATRCSSAHSASRDGGGTVRRGIVCDYARLALPHTVQTECSQVRKTTQLRCERPRAAHEELVAGNVQLSERRWVLQVGRRRRVVGKDGSVCERWCVQPFGERCAIARQASVATNTHLEATET